MSNQAIQIPTIHELISKADKFDYKVTQPEQTHTYICLELDCSHPIVPLLAQYALLVSASLTVWESGIGQETQKRPDFSLITLEQLLKTVQHLEQKPCKHYRGWIGEITSHFLLHHFVETNRDLLNYAWESIQPAKAEVTGGELDIVAVYELINQQLGHISGEVKTYENLSTAKNRAYDDLQKARNWTHNRDAEMRRTLNALLRPKYSIGALQAAMSAMGDERSFLPSLIHCASTQYKKKSTFGDLQEKFDLCSRPSQLIGIQIVISDFGGSCDADSSQTGFFEEFLKQMRLQAIAWKKPSRVI